MRATRQNFEDGIRLAAREIPRAHGKSDWLEVRAHKACEEKWPGLDYVLVLWLDSREDGKVYILQNESEPNFIRGQASQMLNTWECRARVFMGLGE